MNNRYVKAFTVSAAGILFLTGGAKLYSAAGTARILSVTDPLIQLRYGTIMIVVGLIELAITLYLLFGTRLKVKALLVFWLSSNFMVYRFANDFLHIRLCPCLGSIASMLPVSKGVVDFLLMASVLYLFCGSSCILLSDWSRRLKPPAGAALAV